MNDDIPVPEVARGVKGLAFRRFRGDQDLPVIVEVYEAAREEDGLHYILTVDRLKVEYDNTPNFDPRHDVVIAEVDGETVGYSQIYWFHEVDGPLATPHRERVVPRWRGLGIGRALLSINTVRAREMARAHAQGPWRMGTVVADTEVHRRRLLDDAGYHEERFFIYLLRDLGEPIRPLPLPEGLEVRSPAEKDRRRVYEALWEAFRGTYAFREMDEKHWTGFRDSPEFQPELWVVAWDGDEVAGTVLGWIDPVENEGHGRLWGYNDAVGVTKRYRRQGLAKALVTRSLAVLRDRGMEFACLAADTQSPADTVGFYEAMGYRKHKELVDMVRHMDG